MSDRTRRSGFGRRAAWTSAFALAFVVSFARARLPAQQEGATPSAQQQTEFETQLDPRQWGIGEKLPDLAFVDLDGHAGRLSDYADRNALVIVVRDVGCPVGKRYGPVTAQLERDFAPRGVAFLYVDVSKQDSEADCRNEAKDYGFTGRYARDPSGRFGWHLRVSSTTDLFVLDPDRRLRYRGPVDDQIVRGVTKVAPTRSFLKDALEQLLGGKAIALPALSSPGCHLAFDDEPPAEPRAAGPPLDWAGRAGAIVAKRCQLCHVDGGAAPFAFAKADDVASRAAKVRAALLARAMPPWPASDESGPFVNDLRLPPDERLDLLKWIQEGCPADAADTAGAAPFTRKEWAIGSPDRVFEFTLRKAQPRDDAATEEIGETTFDSDRELWFTALQILAYDGTLVRRVDLFTRSSESGRREFLATMLPGQPTTLLAAGVARSIHGGSTLRCEVHGARSGSLEGAKLRVGLRVVAGPLDRTLLSDRVPAAGFTFPSAGEVRRLAIRANRAGAPVRIEIAAAGGRRLTPLSIPKWDPAWPFVYELAKPIVVAPGDVVRCSGSEEASAIVEWTAAASAKEGR
jgi:AhpC/TSA family protein